MDLLTACKLAYRKHHLDDESVGWEELGNALLDALCNECGNCGTFCPYDGLPYKDKLTLFTQRSDFNDSTNNGFIVSGTSESRLIDLRMEGSLMVLKQEEEGELLPVDTQYKNVDVKDDMRAVKAVINAVLRDYSYLIEGV